MRSPIDLDLGHTAVGADAVHVGEAVAQHDGALRQRQRARFADLHLAAHEHAGPQRRCRRHIDVDEGAARLRIERRRDHAHGALDAFAAAGRLQQGDHARLHTRQLGGRHFRAPLQASAADEPEKLLAVAGERADGGAACRDHAVVGGEDARMRQPHVLRLYACFCRRHPRRGRLLGSHRLQHGLLTDEALAVQFLCALAVGSRFGQRGVGLGDGGAGLREVGNHRVGGDAREQLAARDPVADVDRHLGDAQARQFRADHRLLPGGDVAAGGEQLRPVGCLRRGQRDGQRRARGRLARGIGRRLAVQRLRRDRPEGGGAGGDERRGDGYLNAGSCGRRRCDGLGHGGIGAVG